MKKNKKVTAYQITNYPTKRINKINKKSIKFEPTITFHVFPSFGGVTWGMIKEDDNGKDNK